MRHRIPLLIAVSAVASLLATGAASGSHHTCSCSFSNDELSCSVSRTCNEGNYASCSCGNAGCTSGCSADPPPDRPESRESTAVGGAPVDSFTVFTLQNATLEAVKIHLEEMGWRVTVARNPDRRVTRIFQDVTIEQLVSTVAGEFDACGSVDRTLGMVQFLPGASCGRR